MDNKLNDCQLVGRNTCCASMKTYTISWALLPVPLTPAMGNGRQEDSENPVDNRQKDRDRQMNNKSGIFLVSKRPYLKVIRQKE